MALHLLIGMGASALLGLGLLIMKSRGEALPTARGFDIPRAIGAWLRDPIWLGGLMVETAGYALYVFAVAGAPVSLLAVMMQGGIALFVLLAVTVLGERATPREWLGIAAVVVAMLMLAVSIQAGAAEGPLDVRALAMVSAVVLLVALAPIGTKGLVSSGATLAIASGLAFGLAALYTKALTATFLADGGAVWLRAADDPYLYLAAALNIAGLVMLQNAFNRERGIISMPLSSAFSNIVPIAGGMAVFGEHLPAAPLPAAMRIGAFMMTIAGSALLARAD